MTRVGYDPNGLVDMLRIMETRLNPSGWILPGPHPSPSNRIKGHSKNHWVLYWSKLLKPGKNVLKRLSETFDRKISKRHSSGHRQRVDCVTDLGGRMAGDLGSQNLGLARVIPGKTRKSYRRYPLDFTRSEEPRLGGRRMGPSLAVAQGSVRPSRQLLSPQQGKSPGI